jgi:uncharacterized protein
MIKVAESNSFVPSRYLPGGHIQTLARKLKRIEAVQHVRQRIELGDGDFIDVDWTLDSGQLKDSENPTVVILHGLCGCSKSTYVQSLQSRLSHMGFPSVAVNFRGCSGEVNRLAKAYHSGITEDISEVLNALSAQREGQKFALVGFSLGANVVVKWLGENQQAQNVEKAVAVSTPFRLSHCSNAMRTGVSRLYGQFFLRKLINKMKMKTRHFQEQGNHAQWQIMNAIGNLNSLSTIWDFDDQVTAPLHGFAGAEDYYEQCSAIHFLGDVRRPLLLIQSLDDPLIPPGALPVDSGSNANIQLAISSRGGHVGFVSRYDPFWLEHRVIDFLRQP